MLTQGEVGPFQPQVPVEVPLWLAANLKQRQKCRIITPEWMDVGETMIITTTFIQSNLGLFRF